MIGACAAKDKGYPRFHEVAGLFMENSDDKKNGTSGTDHNGDFSRLAGMLQAPPTRDPYAQLTVPILSLSTKEPARILHRWWLADGGTLAPRITVGEIDGAVVLTPTVKTSPVTAIDPNRRRVQTRSGSIYQLGMPESAFAAHARHLLRKMGF